ncbi:hypothetical protein JKP88DRAFT_227087 [Tribonema minus]|uniref:CS domain-containing protein n=1 Tax=Tribonema minus TaxID=303371 RepID=A0A835YKN5_9STRA|nr:hypothetical protein JKP88DRAFT_227087 [Tribonema minus]
MSGIENGDGACLQDEAAELKALLEQVQAPGLHKRLSAVLQSIEAELQGQEQSAVQDEPPAADAEPVAAPVAAPQPVRMPAHVAPVSSAPDKPKFEAITTFAWDQGEYNSEWVSVYVTLPGVGTAKDRVACTFDTFAFDLQVRDLEGKSYRLIKDNLDKEIVPDQSKVLVKKDKVVVKLRKSKGQFGPEHWANLTAKRPHKAAAAKDKDPSASIMEMMKDMYDEGDDNMRKIIGESMLKSQQQRAAGGSAAALDPPSFDDSDFGAGAGAGKFGDLGGMDDVL